MRRLVPLRRGRLRGPVHRVGRRRRGRRLLVPRPVPRLELLGRVRRQGPHLQRGGDPRLRRLGRHDGELPGAGRPPRSRDLPALGLRRELRLLRLLRRRGRRRLRSVRPRDPAVQPGDAGDHPGHDVRRGRRGGLLRLRHPAHLRLQLSAARGHGRDRNPLRTPRSGTGPAAARRCRRARAPGRRSGSPRAGCRSCRA